MSAHRVLAISEDLDQLRRLVATLEGVGAEASASRRADTESVAPLAGASVFMAADRGELAAVHEVAGRLTGDGELVALVPGANLAEVTALLHHPRINHVVAAPDPVPRVFNLAQKLVSGDLFGIEKYVPEGTPVHYMRVFDDDGRRTAVDTVLSSLASEGIRTQVQGAIASVLDELVVNGLFEAPIDEHGQRVFAHIGVHERTSLDDDQRSPKPVSIRYAVTDSGVAVAVRDRYGKLQKQSVLRSIDSSLPRASGAASSPSGLYRVVTASANVVFNVAAEAVTEVVCTFDRGAKAPLAQLDYFLHPDSAFSDIPTNANETSHG